ncbi:MAG: peptidoglycan DD-metalloendopeptidase family protein [bacterium]|nr:peptidoglycan DD-metalloendopeptidase family protein [bacterium]
MNSIQPNLFSKTRIILLQRQNFLFPRRPNSASRRPIFGRLRDIFSNKFGWIVFIFLFSIFYFLFSTVQASTPQDLRDAINQKSAELQQIDSERQKILDNLNELNKESATIQKDIKKNDYQISQLNLSIKSSGITIEKLGLEIESLNSEIKDIGNKSDIEKQAIINLLRELNEKEGEGILNILLKNKSLTDTISETQNLLDLNTNLATEVATLRQLHDERFQKLGDVSQKEQNQEAAKADSQNRKLIVQDQKAEQQNLLAVNKKQGSAYQQRIDELEKIQQAVGAEIDKIESELRAKIDPNILPVPRSGVLAMPLNLDLKANLTQGYGCIVDSFARKSYPACNEGTGNGGFHNGIDIGVPVSTEVFAAENGRVIAVGNTDKYCPPVWYGKKKYGGSYGKYIVIKHDNNLSTLYTHLSLQEVKVGDIVNRGVRIGYSGNTGFSTGSHLHFTVYANIYGGGQTLLSPEIKNSNTCGLQPYGATLNPLDYL